MLFLAHVPDSETDGGDVISLGDTDSDIEMTEKDGGKPTKKSNEKRVHKLLVFMWSQLIGSLLDVEGCSTYIQRADTQEIEGNL